MVFSKRKHRIFDVVQAVAISSLGVGGRNGNNFRVGAVVVRKHCIMAAGVNSYKSKAILRSIYEYPALHAEAAAIIRCGLDACAGSDLYVARVLRDNSLANSRPCTCCQQLIKEAGIRRVFYSDKNGFTQF